MHSRIGWPLAILASTGIGVAVAQTTPTSPPVTAPAVTGAPSTMSTPPAAATMPAAPGSKATMPHASTTAGPPSATTVPGSKAVTTTSVPPGVATSAAPIPGGAPVAGANSFTEGQARARIEGKGYTDVRNLVKDDKSIWRGTATKGGVSTRVALDYQGNVVSN